mmetsp:Transcript_5087/g.15063  ORF Transcript_5087/g.15063 Transcript_5087/m.15063 type:complete len:81 (+) Transcript_5087:1610-1852(+)
MGVWGHQLYGTMLAVATSQADQDEQERSDRLIYDRLYAFRRGDRIWYRCAACARRVFRTRDRYGLFVGEDQAPAAGEDVE